MNAARILIVENERVVALDIQSRVENLGYGIAGVAATGAESVRLAEATRPDLVLMDIMLEGEMDGIQAATLIRARARIPVVYVTAYSDAETLARAKLSEPFGYIHKPLDQRELRATLEMALYKHGIERRLHDNEQWLSTALNSLNEAVVALDARRGVTLMNAVAERLTGWTAADAVGRQGDDVIRLVDEERRAARLDPVAWAAASETAGPRPVSLLARDGRLAPIDLRAALTRDGRGDPSGAVLVFHDRTERQRAAEALRESERKYRTMMEAMSDMAYISAPDYRIEYMNAAMIRKVGRDATGEPCYRAIFGRETPCSWCAYDRIQAGESVQEDVTDPRDGRTYHISSTPIAHADGSVSKMSLITDITARKRTELALQESETRFKRLVESVTDYIYTVKVEHGRAISTYHGPACLAVTGYSSAEYDADPDLWFKMVHVDDRKLVLEQAERLLAGATSQPLEHRIVHKSGMVIWVKNTPVPHRDEAGRLTSYDGLVANITERKLAELQITEHARRLEIINRIIVAVNRAGDQAHLLDEVLSAALELIGFSGGCLYLADARRPHLELACARGLPAGAADAFRRWRTEEPACRALRVEGRALFGEIEAPACVRAAGARAWVAVPLISKDQVIGALLMFDALARPLIFEEKEILQSVGRQIGTAIAKMRSELALRESEEKYRTISEQSVVGLQIIRDGRLVFVNDGWTRIVGYTREEVEGWNADALMRMVHPDDRAFFLEQERRKQAGVEEGIVPVFDCRFLSRQRETKWVIMHSRVVHFTDGPAVVGVVVDITDRKLAEQQLALANRQLKSREEQLHAANQQLFAANEQLKASERNLLAANREKEMLLREIHHRVKNNLQVVSSLLKLQMGHVRDEQAVQVIRECQNRIKSIAIVHEKLYQSQNLAAIDIGEYIRSLAGHLFRMYLADPDSIALEVAVDQVALGIDRAIPCSLIINELVSNSLKYAFPQNRRGTIRVHLRATDDTYLLRVSDDGVGLPPQLDFRNTASLGLQLVLTFVDQLGGVIELDHHAGTAFTITFSRRDAAGGANGGRERAQGESNSSSQDENLVS